MTFVTELGAIFLNALFPLLLYCSIGVAAFRFLDLDRQTLSRFTIYILLPPLIFSNLMDVQVAGQDVFRVALFCLAILGSMALLGLCYSTLVGFDKATTSSTVLSTTFFNAVNLGFPVALFAFGEEGLRYAGLLVAVNAIPHNGFGLYVAARGQMSRRNALIALARMPIFYVLLLATLLRLLDVAPPPVVMAPIAAIGEAAIPVILVCVGMELASIKIKVPPPKLVGVVLLRLCLAPLVAAFITNLIGIDGLLKSVLILLASMPSAMAPIVYARMFGGNVESLTQAVFYSTLGCFISLPLLLMLLR